MSENPNQYPNRTTKIPPTVLPALTSIFTIFIGMVGARSFELSSNNVAILGGSMAVLSVAWLQYKKCKAAEEGRAIAEKSVPGLTTPNGPKALRTVILNDPLTPGPPTVISQPTHLDEQTVPADPPGRGVFGNPPKE